MTDTIADMLTRIRNGIQAGQKEVNIPASTILLGIADVLKREGYIADYKFKAAKPQGNITVHLKSIPVIQKIKRVSTPGRRVYVGYKNIPLIQDGIGTAILSTPNGVLSSREAKKAKVGGELLAYIW